jgi:hypothetical protein
MESKITHCLNTLVEAANGGIGAAKAAGNYAQFYPTFGNKQVSTGNMDR